MSQITFSHQFPHRWLAAPKLVKDAIVQELDDIVSLLDSDTDLESFEFSTSDLRHYIDQVYADISEQQINDNEVSDVQSNDNDAHIEDTHIEADSISFTDSSIDMSDDTSSVVDAQSEAAVYEQAQTHVVTLHNNKNDDSKTVSLDEDFLHELEVRIDDYLTEQLSDISENLKAWLREEVKQYIDKN